MLHERGSEAKTGISTARAAPSMEPVWTTNSWDWLGLKTDSREWNDGIPNHEPSKWSFFCFFFSSILLALWQQDSPARISDQSPSAGCDRRLRDGEEAAAHPGTVPNGGTRLLTQTHKGLPTGSLQQKGLGGLSHVMARSCA